MLGVGLLFLRFGARSSSGGLASGRAEGYCLIMPTHSRPGQRRYGNFLVSMVTRCNMTALSLTLSRSSFGWVKKACA